MQRGTLGGHSSHRLPSHLTVFRDWPRPWAGLGRFGAAAAEALKKDRLEGVALSR
jgi:hypothetical protein